MSDHFELHCAQAPHEQLPSLGHGHHFQKCSPKETLPRMAVVLQALACLSPHQQILLCEEVFYLQSSEHHYVKQLFPAYMSSFLLPFTK